jgi:predicted RNA-binding Zn ribbon-like protein
MVQIPLVSEHDLLGGRLALDFVNTVEPRTGLGQRDFLPDYRALAAWMAYSGGVTPEEAARLSSAASADIKQADAVWRRAIALREALYRIVLAVAEDRRPASADLAALTRAFARTQRHAMLTVESAEIRWSWDSPTDVERPLWEVARSAIEILTGDDANRLGVCCHETDGCGWVYLDATKNGSRRWCGMADCGTKAKSRRLTERRRQERGRPQPAPRTQPIGSAKRRPGTS